MGNNNSKQVQQTPTTPPNTQTKTKNLDDTKAIKADLLGAMKNLAGEKVAYSAMEFLNKPQDMLTGITLPPKFKQWVGYVGAAVTGGLLTSGIAGAGLLHHAKGIGLVALKGLSMPAWAAVIGYVALAANIAMIVVQIRSIYKTSQILQKNKAYLRKTNTRIEKIREEVVKLLQKCNRNEWKELAKPEGMQRIDNLLTEIVDIQAEINLKMIELEDQKKFMTKLAIGGAGLSLLTVVGGACILGLVATGIGGLVLLGGVIATGVAVGIAAGVAGYYAYQCDKQLTDFRKAKAKLDVLAATLRAIRENIETNTMKPMDVKNWLLDRGLENLGNDGQLALSYLEKEHYLVVDIIKQFKEKEFLKVMGKYDLKITVQKLLVTYLKDFQTKIISGEKLLDNLEEDISSLDDYKNLLTKWRLDQYTDNFTEEGYDSVKEWKSLELKELVEVLKMKRGHAKTFMRCRDKYFKKYEKNDQNE